MIKTRKVLTNGYVSFVGYVGRDHKDSTVCVQFEIKCPSVFLKNFTSVTNLRETEEFYVPSYFLGNFTEQDQNDLNTKVQNFNNWSFNFYKKLLARGVSKEQAKMLLPQNTFVKFTWTVYGHELIAFVNKFDTTSEFGQYTKILLELFKEQFPTIGNNL